MASKVFASGAAVGVFPGMQGHEGDLGGTEAVAQGVEQGEILQSIRSDFRFDDLNCSLINVLTLIDVDQNASSSKA